ncbi:class I SAM-dependent methyltransferase [Agarivorans aestuarii]|uniref:class I SAM-dependent methyltransferase n=1 Tax=Agarivorans aestuarii TaxID=1563703 RepID=UPI001C81B0D1|nr:class I SAM-dependent methyltransferase [Agarivorans aestuarii]
MSSIKWTQFWKEHGKSTSGHQAQEQVLRTSNKEVVSESVWANTLEYLQNTFEVNDKDVLLDLCCGNGLITQYFSDKCQSVTSVDVTPEFIQQLNALKLPNVEAICTDLLSLDFPKHSFSKIILYAGIQYFSEDEVISLFKKFSHWLKPNGMLFVGDIPDKSKLWDFYNSKEREHFYFERCEERNDVVGTWFEKQWLCKLSEFTGLAEPRAWDQPNEQIYAHFRFDMKAEKK